MINTAKIEITRKTKETDIAISLRFCDDQSPSSLGNLSIDTPVPFFSHMLNAMLFHGAWAGSVIARGDTDVDPHHLVEDVGIVLGEICAKYAFDNQPYKRFGHAVIPMDDALAECTVDFSNRAFLHYEADFPQDRAGDFDASLAREFFTSFAHNARINLHITARYGLNSHHMLEAMFKACGRAVRESLQAVRSGEVQSTKGVL